MKDEDLEALLRAHRPLGPPPELRARVVASATMPRASFVLEWLPTAAALVFTILFYWLTANQQEIIASHFEPVPPIDQANLVTPPPDADSDR